MILEGYISLGAWKTPLLCIYMFSYAVYEPPWEPENLSDRCGWGAGSPHLQVGFQPLPPSQCWCGWYGARGTSVLSERKSIFLISPPTEDFHKNVI